MRDLKALPIYKFKNAKFLRHGDGAAINAALGTAKGG